VIISKKVLTLFTFACFAFMPKSYAMKSEPVDKNGEWQEFDVNPYLENSSPKIKHFTFSYDGKFFCGVKTSKKSTTLYLWNSNNVKPQMIFYDVINYFFSPKGNFLVIEKMEEFDKIFVEIYSLRSYTLVASFRYESLFFFPDESFLSDKWTCMLPPRFFMNLNSQKIKRLQLPGDIMNIKFSNQISCQDCMAGVLYANGNLLNDGMEGIFHKYGNLEIFDVKTGCEFKEKIFSFKNVCDFEFIPNSNFLKIQTLNSQNILWDMTTGKQVSLNNRVSFSPDRTVCVKEENKHHCLRVFEKINGKEVASFKKVEKFSFSSQGTFLGVLLKDKTLKIRHTKTWTGWQMFGISDFEFIGCDNVIRLVSCDASEKPQLLQYVPYKNIFDSNNYKNTNQKDKIQNFFSGQTLKKVKYADLSVLFQ